MPLGRILPQPNGTLPVQPACAARAQPARLGSSSANIARAAHGLAQLSRRDRAHGMGVSVRDDTARSGATRAPDGAARVCYDGDLTGAREAAGESTAGPHQRVDGGAAELVGVDDGARPTRDDGGEVSATGTVRERSGAAYSPARWTAVWCSRTRGRRRATRGEWPGCRGVGTWQPHGDGALTGGPDG
jgi:hypothetical protein